MKVQLKNQHYWHHLGAYCKCRISGSAPVLPDQNLHLFYKIPPKSIRMQNFEKHFYLSWICIKTNIIMNADRREGSWRTNLTSLADKVGMTAARDGSSSGKWASSQFLWRGWLIQGEASCQSGPIIGVIFCEFETWVMRNRSRRLLKQSYKLAEPYKIQKCLMWEQPDHSEAWLLGSSFHYPLFLWSWPIGISIACHQNNLNLDSFDFLRRVIYWGWGSGLPWGEDQSESISRARAACALAAFFPQLPQLTLSNSHEYPTSFPVGSTFKKYYVFWKCLWFSSQVSYFLVDLLCAN